MNSIISGIGQRIEVFEEKFVEFWKAPLLGVGYIQTKRRSSTLYDKEFTYRGYKSKHSAHNQYLAFLVNHGIIGFTVFISFLVVMSKKMIFIAKRNHLERQYLTIFIIFIISMLGWESFYILPLFSFVIIQLSRVYVIAQTNKHQ